MAFHYAIRIEFIIITGQALPKVLSNGSWHQAIDGYICIDNAWRKIVQISIAQGGVWLEIIN